MKFYKLTNTVMTTSDGEIFKLPLDEAIIIKDSDLMFDLFAYRCGSSWSCLAIDLSNIEDNRIVVDSYECQYVFTHDGIEEVFGRKYEVMECKIHSVIPYGFDGFNRLMNKVCGGLLEVC